MPRVPLVIKPAARPGAVNPRVPVNIRPAPARPVPARPPIRPVPVRPVPVSPVPVNPGGLVVTRVTLPLHESTRLKCNIWPEPRLGEGPERRQSRQEWVMRTIELKEATRQGDAQRQYLLAPWRVEEEHEAWMQALELPYKNKRPQRIASHPTWAQRLAAHQGWRPPEPTFEMKERATARALQAEQYTAQGSDFRRVRHSSDMGYSSRGDASTLYPGSRVTDALANGIGIWWIPPEPGVVVLDTRVVCRSGVLKSDLASWLDPLPIPRMPDGSVWSLQAEEWPGENPPPSTAPFDDAAHRAGRFEWSVAWQERRDMMETWQWRADSFASLPDIICYPGDDPLESLRKVNGEADDAVVRHRQNYPVSRNFVVALICPHPGVTQEVVRVCVEGGPIA